MESQSTLATLRAIVIMVARRVFTKAHRLFIEPDDPVFVELVVEDLLMLAEDQRTEAKVERLVKYTYSQLLYAAYMSDGSQEQIRAFSAAQAHTFPRLAYRLQDDGLAASLTQDALGEVWKTLRKNPLRDPGTFSYYLSRTALHAMLRAIKQGGILTSIDDQEHPISGANPDQIAPGTRTAQSPDRPVEDDAVRSEIAARLGSAVDKCLKDRPELKRIIRANVLDGKRYPELAREWGLSVQQLAMLKFRALKALRKCPDILALL